MDARHFASVLAVRATNSFTMSNPERKFRTRHKFGAKKVRRTLVANFTRRSVIPQNPQDSTLSASDGEVVDATTEEGLASASAVAEPVQGPSAADPSSSGRVRQDTLYRQRSDLEEEQAKAEKKLSELSSAAATERKRVFVGDCADDAARPPDKTTFTIIDLDTVNSALLAFAKCKACNGELQIVRDDREFGLAVKLRIVCSTCGETASLWSSPRVCSDERMKPFTVNVLAARAMQATGNRQTALNDVFSLMGISRRGLHTKTWQHYVKTKLAPAADRAARNLTSDCARSVRELYAELNIGHTGNIAVSYDGTWMTRGHSSHIGVGTVIELAGWCLTLLF